MYLHPIIWKENSMCYKCAQYSNWAAEYYRQAPRHYDDRINPNFNAIAAALVCIFLWFVQPATADVSGTILGTVTDPTAAVVPGAKVVLRNANTGLVRETVTDGSGSYEFLAVPVGEDYSVEVEAQSFRKSAQANIKLLVNQRWHAD